jgi:hypothetical protein
VYFGVLDCVFSVILIATFNGVRGCCLGQSELDEIFFRVSLILLKTHQVPAIFPFEASDRSLSLVARLPGYQ